MTGRDLIKPTLSALTKYVEACTGPDATESTSDLKLLVLTVQTMNFMAGYIEGLEQSVEDLKEDQS